MINHVPKVSYLNAEDKISNEFSKSLDLGKIDSEIRETVFKNSEKYKDAKEEWHKVEISREMKIPGPLSAEAFERKKEIIPPGEELNKKLPDESVDKNAPGSVVHKKNKIIRNLAKSNEKIINYLKTGLYKKVLIIFHHGLGDLCIFYAAGILDKLKEMFPDIEFSLNVHLGQEEIAGICDDNPAKYDIAFDIQFPMSEYDFGKQWNKAEKSMVLEFGIMPEFGKSTWKLPVEFPNRLVGVHFFSTGVASLSANERVARSIWNYIERKNFVPIETHMCHQNSKAELYPFEKTNIFEVKPRISKLFGVLKALGGFAGVSSGNFCAALTVLPPRKIMFIQTDFPASRITTLPVHQLDVRRPETIDYFEIDRWLKDVIS